jgi:hypothetical protein
MEDTPPPPFGVVCPLRKKFYSTKLTKLKTYSALL